VLIPNDAQCQQRLYFVALGQAHEAMSKLSEFIKIITFAINRL
jgi:hypothetical protein